jgi:hypothetical protein
MYEEIMRSGRYSFFSLFNFVFPESDQSGYIIHSGLKTGYNGSVSDKKKDNEWMQEYYIIYNSYVLDHKESAEIID